MNNLPALPLDQRLALAGQAANLVAARRVFDDYRSRRADNTLRRQEADLALFKAYLAEVGINTYDLATDPAGWQGITWGIVQGFVQWQLKLGYAIGSVNVRLTTVKVYAKLALKAGAIDGDQQVKIAAVSGYSLKEGKRINARREVKRVGHKKEWPVKLTEQQAARLLDQPDDPQGRRDRLMLCLLLRHGLRCGEVAILQVDDIDLVAEHLSFYRPKVDKIQIHQLTPETLAAAGRYMIIDAMGEGPLLRASLKDGNLSHAGLSEQAITARVRLLGGEIGVTGLSAHDCRHFWATQAARAGTDPFSLQEAGGWSSLAMPRRYVEAAKVANQGVKL